MKHKTIIYGCGNLDIFKLINAINKDRDTIRVIGILDDMLYGKTKDVNGVPVLGNKEMINKYKEFLFINNVYSSSAARYKINTLLKGCELMSVIHPDIDLHEVHTGNGIHMAEGVLVGTRVRLMDNVIIRVGAIINHDCVLGNNVIVSTGAVTCGNVKVNHMAYIGAGAVIRDNLTVGEGAVVGMGAVVVKDVEPGVTVVGCPARPMQK